MRIKITTPTCGTVRATYTDDWAAGATTYTVTAPRVAGVFVVSAEVQDYSGDLDVDTPHVRVDLGRGTHRYYTDPYDRTERPVINGVRVAGGMVINTDKMRTRRLTRWDVRMHRPTSRYTSTAAPDRTQDRGAEIVEALLTHWLTRPDNLALRLAAVRRAAGATKDALTDKITKQRDRIAEARRELQQLQEQAATAEMLAAMPAAATRRPDNYT